MNQGPQLVAAANTDWVLVRELDEWFEKEFGNADRCEGQTTMCSSVPIGDLPSGSECSTEASSSLVARCPLAGC